MIAQTCPNCAAVRDVSVYVTGQRVLCSCGIRFEVRRENVVTHRPTGATSIPVGPGNPPEATFISSGARIDIPGYDLLEILGRGGMGEVWRSRQKSLGREVAIKLLPPKLSKDPESVARFEKEATALASLSHAHIIQIIDRGISGDHYYLVMEYVQGRSLRELMNAGEISFRQALKLTLQICAAIDYAHQKQIIHRDLKPENILIDTEGQAKVADFGLAGIGNSDTRLNLTATAVAMGTMNYMAPEQRRDAKNVDGRADIYSLGVVLYEMLTGEIPIGRFKLPSERVGQLDPRVDAVVAKALETDPNARYPRAGMMANDLETILGTASERPSQMPSTSRKTISTPRQLVVKGWRGLRLALTIIGALATAGLLLKWAFGPASGNLRGQSGSSVGVAASASELAHFKKHGHLGAGKYPPNTNGALLISAEPHPKPAGAEELCYSFEPGPETLAAYAGSWKLQGGQLQATQAGTDTGGHKLIPRAYLANRYFAADEATAEVQVTLRDLEADFPTEQNSLQFAELAFRNKGLQISVFAISDLQMRLQWRYETANGTQITGNSADDTQGLVEDEMPTPSDGTPFRIKLSLRRHKGGGTEVEAFVNGERFAHRILHGLSTRSGRIALGCRNSHCNFDQLTVEGRPVSVAFASGKFEDDPE